MSVSGKLKLKENGVVVAHNSGSVATTSTERIQGIVYNGNRVYGIRIKDGSSYKYVYLETYNIQSNFAQKRNGGSFCDAQLYIRRDTNSNAYSTDNDGFSYTSSFSNKVINYGDRVYFKIDTGDSNVYVNKVYISKSKLNVPEDFQSGKYLLYEYREGNDKKNVLELNNGDNICFDGISTHWLNDYNVSDVFTFDTQGKSGNSAVVIHASFFKDVPYENVDTFSSETKALNVWYSGGLTTDRRSEADMDEIYITVTMGGQTFTSSRYSDYKQFEKDHYYWYNSGTQGTTGGVVIGTYGGKNVYLRYATSGVMSGGGWFVAKEGDSVSYTLKLYWFGHTAEYSADV